MLSIQTQHSRLANFGKCVTIIKYKETVKVVCQCVLKNKYAMGDLGSDRQIQKS